MAFLDVTNPELLKIKKGERLKYKEKEWVIYDNNGIILFIKDQDGKTDIIDYETFKTKTKII